MLNHVSMAGKLCRDPELRKTGSGVSVCSFRIAVDRDFNGKDEGGKTADFFDVVAWRHTADFVSTYFSKGRTAIVAGRLQNREWTDEGGNKRTTNEIIAKNVYFGDYKRDGDNHATTGGDQYSANGIDMNEDDELPF